MAINYIKGQLLSENLVRTTNLSFDTDLLYLDVLSGFIGIKTALPSQALEVTGNIKASNSLLAPSAIIGNLTLGSDTITTSGTDLILTSASSNIAVLGNLKFNALAAEIQGPSATSVMAIDTAASTNVPYYLGNLLPAPAHSLDASPAAEVPAGIFVTPDGLTAFYVEETVQGTATTVRVYQTTLSIAHDMSSAGNPTLTDVTGGVSALATHGITFDATGATVYISRYLNAGVDTTVEKFTLTNGNYDLSATVASTTKLFTDADTLNFAPVMSSDGAKAYVGAVHGATRVIYEYTLGTAYDLTTAGVLVNTYDMTTEIAHATNYITISISDDGTEILAAQYDGANNQIAKYTLGTPYSLGGTVTLADTATPGTLGVVNSMWFKSDGAGTEDGWELYWLDDAGLIYQYDTHTVPGDSTVALHYHGTENLITTVDGPEVSGQLILPSYTTALLPATSNAGGLVFDTDLKQIKVHNGTSWVSSGTPTGVMTEVLSTLTANTTPTEVFTDGTGGTGRLVLPDDSTWRFEINVVSRQTTATTITSTNFVTGTRYVILTTGTTDFTLIGAANSTPGTVFNATGPGLGDGTASVGEIGDSGGYQFTGVIARQTGVANTAIVGVVAEVIDAEDNALWLVTVDADTTNGSLRIQVTGEATDIKWVVFVRIVEVTN